MRKFLAIIYLNIQAKSITYQMLLTYQALIMAIYDLTSLVANKVSLLLAHPEYIKRNRLIMCCYGRRRARFAGHSRWHSCNSRVDVEGTVYKISCILLKTTQKLLKNNININTASKSKYSYKINDLPAAVDPSGINHGHL